ncbi:Concanavalin A-like lectin/glucanase subgroup [Penicillium sp. DV-2018c]|nr:Concanavalin A-like lectin/glucanase subgroup [Penicillium sp. DV-2018c]
MSSFMKLAVAALAAAAPLVSAQTYTDCNPMEQGCPANRGLAKSDVHFDFSQSSALDQFRVTGGSVPIGSDGAVFTINKEGDAPTITSRFYFFYGEISIVMKTSAGQGIVSSAFLQSDDLDEIDWEALGTTTDKIETNYFGKGDTTTYDRQTWPAVSDLHNTFHTYGIKWTKESVVWLIDGAPVRTLNYNDAQGGSRFPQTPMNVHIGIWAGGAPTNPPGTIEWAGGLTDYSKGPYSMYIKSIDIKNYSPAKSYLWTDRSGSSDSIKLYGSDAVESSTTATSDATASFSTKASATTESYATKDESSVESTVSGTSTATVTILLTKTSSVETTVVPSATASGSGTATVPASPSQTTGSGSGSGSGSSSSSGSGSISHSGTGSSTSASSSPTFNAAASVAASYLGPVSLLGLVVALLQL